MNTSKIKRTFSIAPEDNSPTKISGQTPLKNNRNDSYERSNITNTPKI